MSDPVELPEGVTLNDRPSVNMDLEIEYENVNSIECDNCGVTFEGVLVINFGRHEGYIVLQPAGTLAWKNALSKNKEKAKKILDETLKTRVDTHKERCNND